jgi:hypothetical protein
MTGFAAVGEANHGSRFSWEKSLRSFGFGADANVDPVTVHMLANCEGIKKSQPLGPSGTPARRSHMLIALGTEAAMKG